VARGSWRGDDDDERWHVNWALGGGESGAAALPVPLSVKNSPSDREASTRMAALGSCRSGQVLAVTMCFDLASRFPPFFYF
jgi:hypothetical protein